MSSDLFDFDELLAAISEESPCGSQYEEERDSQLRTLYSEMKWLASEARQLEAKRQERASLHPDARNDQQSEVRQEPNWDRVAELSLAILKGHSKDTRVLINLIDSYSTLFGLKGLTDSLNICLQLIERYELQLYPVPEMGDPAYACLEILNKAFGQEENQVKRALRQIEFFGSGEGFTWFAFDHASAFEGLDVDVKQRYIEAGDRTANDFSVTIQKITKLSDITEIEEQLTTAVAIAKKLDDIIGKLSDNRAGIRGVCETLAKMQRWYRGLTEVKRKELESLASVETVDSSSGGGSVSTTGTFGGNVTSREQALVALSQIASFFLRTEPHSPLAYALDQAVRWGKMPLPELLKEILEDDASLRSVFKRMGIQDKSDDND